MPHNMFTWCNYIELYDAWNCWTTVAICVKTTWNISDALLRHSWIVNFLVATATWSHCNEYIELRDGVNSWKTIGILIETSWITREGLLKDSRIVSLADASTTCSHCKTYIEMYAGWNSLKTMEICINISCKTCERLRICNFGCDCSNIVCYHIGSWLVKIQNTPKHVLRVTPDICKLNTAR